ncbi:MAG: hypothetical protein GW763_03885 [Paraglaciecola sp.]|nr:hypothetical protein [Paraglaciecola sp.]NCT47127.1 hypothetical protein [Paraglaciecola sp.]
MKKKAVFAILFAVTSTFSVSSQANTSKQKPIDPQTIEVVWYTPILDFFGF